ncbi:MAG TPA: adenylate/guanylate cyclase domain-containing protein [Verrucomicrobiae bacterium]|nr:adenylate/guanylate cyclase domain-containing protein [Verrucomicrobiae bacterium]
MPDLPSGTVTFLFTDIEGSTRLVHALGDAYAKVRSEHTGIIRSAIAAGDGTEVDTAGDSFFAAFASPQGAVNAAVMAQRDLQAHDWPEGARVRVRMGLHTGQGVVSGSHYVGMDVHRAARIADAAHGGQVVVSAATRSLVEHSLAVGISLRDLGEHRLKDILHLEHLYDLVVAGLPAEFPPPRTLDARPNNLPAQLTSFVGREEQIAEIRQLLDRTRLLTLTGPGGTGKTRVALQIAAETLTDYRDGCFFVDLAPITDPALVPAVMARALGVPETPGISIIEGLQAHLRERELLLVVDNFEQVAIAAPVLEQLLTAARRVKALVTSRVVLSLRGEHEYSVPPLQSPDLQPRPDPDDLKRFEAVRLFTERALAVQPRFRLTAQNAQAVAEITARLDGLPLAIELAATRTKVLPPEELLARLQRSLTLLTSGARTLPERQRTLRGAISWSYDLLTEAERRLFTRLSVFGGGWTLAAAEGVAQPEELGLDALDGLSSLVDKSLIRADEPNGRPRFSMLETIREFGQEQLSAAGELDLVRQRHGQYFLELALEAEAHLTGVDQGEWLGRLEREHGNVRGALRWAVDTGQAQLAQEAAGALWRFWHQHGHLAEGRRWLDEILAMPSGHQPNAARGKALTGAGGIAWWQIDHPAARAFYDEALAVERQVGEPARIAEALYNDAFALGAAGDLQAANHLLEESLRLYRQVDDEQGVARALVMLVLPDAQAGKWDLVTARIEEAVSIWRRLGERLQLAFDLIWLAFAYGRAGRRQDAHQAAVEALSIFREADNATGIALAFRDLAFLAVWEGRPRDALQFAGAADTLRERIGGGPPQGFGGMLEGDPAAEARSQMADAEAERSWQDGRSLDVEAASDLSRRWSEPDQ